MRHTRLPALELIDGPVTPEVDLRLAQDAVRLRRVWDAEKDRRGADMSQKAMAADWGVHPSNVTQYLQGHIKLNVEARLRFAQYLKKPLLEIWPDFEFADVAPGDLPAVALEIAARWAALPAHAQTAVRNLILSLGERS
jgi:hypothetical protein